MNITEIHYEDIPSSQTCVKFKEYFYDTNENKMIPTLGDSYYRINLDRIDVIILDKNSNIVSILGMSGVFFI